MEHDLISWSTIVWWSLKHGSQVLEGWSQIKPIVSSNSLRGVLDRRHCAPHNGLPDSPYFPLPLLLLFYLMYVNSIVTLLLPKSIAEHSSRDNRCDF